MSPPRQAILLDARNGWRTATSAGVGTLGPAGLHLTGVDGTADAFGAIPAWLAAPAWADQVAYLLGLDGWLRRYDPVTGRFAEIISVLDFGVAPGDPVELAASREDVYVLDARRARILVFAGLGYLRQVLRLPRRWDCNTASC